MDTNESALNESEPLPEVFTELTRDLCAFYQINMTSRAKSRHYFRKRSHAEQRRLVVTFLREFFRDQLEKFKQ